MKLIDGKKQANDIKEKLKKEISTLKEQGVIPGLAIILVGHDPASEIYVKNKIKTCDELGICTLLYRFTEESSEKEIIAQIKDLNEDDGIDGILIQSPLPAIFNEDKIISYVDIPNQAGLLASGGIGDAMESEKLIDAIKNTKPIKPFDFGSHITEAGKHE